MNHATLTRWMHSRGAFVVAALIAAAGTVIAYLMHTDTSIVPSQGFVKGWDSQPFELPREASLCIAIALNGCIAALMLHINNVYNLLRQMTRMQVSMFLIFLLSTPAILYSVSPGTLLCIIILWCMWLMYLVYGQVRCDTPKVFLVFCILSACSTFNYAYALYVPIFILACLQLRFFSLRCTFAIIMGLATPWILLFGFGVLTPDKLQLPIESFRLSSLGDKSTALLTSTVLFTAFVGIGSLLQNVIKIITYNAQSRAMLSVLSTITIVTAIFAILDVSNAYVYVTMLDCCAAFQIAHLFVAIHNFPKSYLGVLCITIIYILLYVWNLII